MNFKDALLLAYEAHDGQIRKMSNLPYIIHPISIASKFKDENYKIVAILHDVIEDTNISMSDLINFYKLSSFLIEPLNLLTRKDNETYLEYLLNIKSNEMAIKIKIEDLKHNLINPLNKCSKDKYLMALYILEEI